MAQIIENENVVIIDNGEEVSYHLYTVIHHYKTQGGWGGTRRVKLIAINPAFYIRHTCHAQEDMCI